MCAMSKPKPTVQYVSLPVYFCFLLAFHIFCFCLQSMLQLKELLPISYLKDTLVNIPLMYCTLRRISVYIMFSEHS